MVLGYNACFFELEDVRNAVVAEYGSLHGSEGSGSSEGVRSPWGKQSAPPSPFEIEATPSAPVPKRGVARSFAQMATILEDPNLTLNTSTRGALERAAQALRDSPPGSVTDPVSSGPARIQAARWLAEDIKVVGLAKVTLPLQFLFLNGWTGHKSLV